MSAHTPGPWLCKYAAGQTVYPGTTVAEVGPTSTDVARWWIFSDADQHGSSEADARLIAAAPELLEALRLWIDIHDKAAGFAGKYGKALDEAIAAQQAKVDAAISTARAAIAKATKEQQP